MENNIRQTGLILNKSLKIENITKENFMQFKKRMIRMYKEVFSVSSWKEWKKCLKCWNKWEFENAPEKCCGIETVDFYRDIKVEESILKVLNKTYYQCMLLISQNEQLAWFTWWWKDDLDSINEEKLKLPSWKLIWLRKTLDRSWIEYETWWLYYQSETWINPPFRKKWLWKALVLENELLLQKNKDKVATVIQRTSRLSPMFKIREDLGYELVYEYKDSDQRVLFAKNNI